MKNTDPRALNIVKSWLTACGITFQPGRHPQADLLVCNATGSTVGVSVSVKGSYVADDSIVVDGASITHRDLRKSLEAFRTLQLALGYDAETPVDRGPIPKRRPYGDDFDLVAMRHSEFRRAPNPDPRRLQAYFNTVERASWKFFRANQRLCADQMLSVEDLRTFALVWTTIYIGQYEIPAERVTNNDNEHLLFTYLAQRFAEFRTSLIRKGRNELPVLDAAFIGTRGRPYDYNNKAAWQGAAGGSEDIEYIESCDEPSERINTKLYRRAIDEAHDDEQEDTDYVARHCVLDVSSPAARRTSATALLETLLAGLPHDQLIQKLTLAAESDRIHTDARKEAARRLRTHQQHCPTCAGLALPVSAADDEDEQEAETAA
jgi:hypothetical protein